MATRGQDDRLQALSRAVRRADFDPLRADDRPDAGFEAAWRQAFKRRLVLVAVAAALWTAGIEARLVYLQVVRHAELLETATDQQLRMIRPAAKRGEILDRHGEILAYSVDADTVVANPKAITDAAKTAAALCATFGDCSKKDVADLTASLDRPRAFASVRRSVSAGLARRIAALQLPGIWLLSETQRYYPKRELASHVIGFVGRDNTGLGGIEQAYDTEIRGRDGRVLMLTDARHNSIESRVELAPTAGATLELTIDQNVQHIVERELQAGVEANRARGGTAIVMDPATGEILAMANWPTFNANTPGLVEPEVRRNRAIQEIYEPGSTFKMVTAAAAIEEHVLTTEDLIDCAPGFIKIGSRKPIVDVHAYGLLTFGDVIVKSSNVGAIKAGWRVGAERLNRYVHRFGFGEVFAPDFRGVSRGIVWKPEDLDDSALASVSIGYQVGVTPLQMAAAVSAVANGGTLYEPRVVRAVIRDGRREVVPSRMVRTVISPATAAALTTIMEEVATRGTARAARLEGYQVAGKTGTAAKVVNGRYSDTEYNASFIGFAPSRRPAIAVLVVIDSPSAGHYYGGDVAAPIFQKISQAVLRQMGVPSSLNPTPPVVVTADATLERAPPVPRDVVLRPVAYHLDGQPLMPDVLGLGARDALRVLGQVGLSVRVSGSGVVRSQSPAAGEPIEPGGVSVLRLDRAMANARPPAGGGE